eukprot:5536872-Prymnesium_polylepis.1
MARPEAAAAGARPSCGGLSCSAGTEPAWSRRRWSRASDAGLALKTVCSTKRHPCMVTFPYSCRDLSAEFAERRNFYTKYVHFGGSFGIRIMEYVWNTVGLL